MKDEFPQQLSNNPGQIAFEKYIAAQRHVPASAMDGAWEELSYKLAAARQPASHGSRRRWASMAVGAGILALLVLGVKSFPNIFNGPGAVAKNYIYKTASGQRASVVLSDGSAVTLAPMTTLQVTGRNVQLDGEAVFTVTNNSGTPFIVKTRNTSVRVLGTTFGVRAYRAESKVDVLVAEGRVALSNGRVLTMGDMSSVDSDGATSVKRGDVVALLSWTQGRHVYQGVPLEQFARDLERWYGITITITDSSLAARPISTDFTQRPAEEILSMLARTLDIQYVRDGSHITLTPR